MKVGIICEFSGTVRDAFIRRGHDAISCDLLPTETPGPHIQGDARDHNWSGFDLLVCHPPCTYLCNSGVRWLATEPGRWDRMREACRFFQWCMEQAVRRIAVENPVMHGYAEERIGPWSQTVQPWQFGHGEVKRTCLWLRGLPHLEPTDVVDGREARVHRASPGPNRWKERSVTYQGIADAMAEQWGAA